MSLKRVNHTNKYEYTALKNYIEKIKQDTTFQHTSVSAAKISTLDE